MNSENRTYRLLMIVMGIVTAAYWTINAVRVAVDRHFVPNRGDVFVVFLFGAAVIGRTVLDRLLGDEVERL